eukprot:g6978.t1
MSASSLVPKIVRNMFKGRKKRNPGDNTESVTMDDSAAMEPLDYSDWIPDVNCVEDIHYQIAVALSRVDARETQSADGESTASARNRQLASGGNSSNSEVLSSIYYFNGVIDYDVRICDGFYDVWGEFPEVTSSRSFPSLKPLKRMKLDDGDLREVVLFNRTKDSVFPLIEEAAHEAMLKLIPQGRVACIQGLAQIVSAQMGGAVYEERALYKRWIRSSQKAKAKFRSAVYPIGKLKSGLSRHRALLYKLLADSVQIGCRLVRGLPYKDSASQAVSLVMVGDTEVIVDLICQPGRLFTLDRHGPNDKGTEVLFAEAPATPSEPYWVSMSTQRGSRRHQVQTEETPLSSTTTTSPWPPVTQDSANVQIEEVGQTMLGTVQVPPSAFSDIKTPFDPPSPGRQGGQSMQMSDFLRKGSSAMSTDPCHDSGAWSNPSAQGGGINRQFSSNSALSGNSWAEENDVITTTSLKQAHHQTTNRLGTNYESPEEQGQLPNASEGPNTTGPYVEPEGDTVPPVGYVFNQITSPFSGFDLPAFDGVDEEQDNETEGVGQDPQDTAHFRREQNSGSYHPTNDVASPAPVNSFLDDDCNIPTSEIQLEFPRLAVGSYGEVFKGTWNGTDVAVKKLLEQDVSSVMLEEFLSEVKIMKRLRHPNVLLFMGACMQPPNLAIVTEFLPRGSLYKLLHKTQFNDDRLKLKMAKDVIKGMCYLHSHKPAIVHRDLKSPNLLVDKDWTVKVCDFGMSKMKANTYLSGKGQGGTPEWMAPEVLRNERSDEKCDVYSFGVILYELVTGMTPWPTLKPMQVVGAVGYNGQQLDLPLEVDSRIANIIKQCWSRDSHKRPSFQELLVMLSQFETLPCIPKTTSTNSFAA